MPRNVLVVGEAGLLASYLAASRLLSTDDSVFFDIDCAEGPFSDDELATLVRHAIRQVALNEHLDSFEGRLHRPAQESNGAQTGLSKTSLGETLVSEVRVRKLNASGVITANRATVAPAALGMTLCAFIFVDLEARADEEAFRKAIIRLGEFQELHHITGPHGYLVKARAADAAALQALLEAIKRLPSVERTETIVALGTHKETTLIEASPATLKPTPAKRQRQTATGRADKPRQRGRR